MSKRVLIIDDEEHIRRMMRLTLEAAGYGVGEAGDGSEGIKLYGDGSAWDGVVLDQRMPGMDGLETLRRLKAGDPRVRVVMATAYASIELAVEAMKLGASDFVRKPMTPETLRNAIAAAFAKDQAVASQSDAPSPPQQPSPPTIETITMNGFSILDPEKEEWQLPEQRRFTVVSPAGTRHDVLVEIDEEALGYVARLTRRNLPAANSFWTGRARRLLSDYLWNEGDVPRTRKLILRQLSPEELLIAQQWPNE